MLLAMPAAAVHIRVYNPAVHDRFTVYSATPVMNPGFLYDPLKFTGVGFHSTEGHKQFALVSPRHFLCADHHKPSVLPGHVIRFVATDGTVLSRAITGMITIEADNTGLSDLTLGTFASDLPANVKPLPYLNLAEEEDYAGRELIVFGYGLNPGTIVCAGRGVAGSTLDLDLDGPAEISGDTRVLKFVYSGAGGSPDDARFIGGDSGSPSFVMEGGQPALTGVHLGVEPSGVDFNNYDTFVPHYVPKLDLQLAASGYRMRPVIFTPVTLTYSASPAPAVFEAGEAASASITVENTGAVETGNLAATLTFPTALAPASVTASGCVVESVAAGVWQVRKALVAASEEIVVTAAWTDVPNTAAITASIAVQSDTSTPSVNPLSIPVAVGYAVWSEDLVEGGQTDDPDGDGWNNLLEYALGSPPESGSFSLPGGGSLRPTMTFQGGTVALSYPERENATLLGLSYQVEMSTDLETEPWATTLPVGTVSSTQPFVPALSGFVKRTLMWPQEAPEKFARVKVELAE